MTNLLSFDLNLLKILDAMLRTNSTTAAAEHVGLSQPAVSAGLSRLRSHLGDPLFVRQGQRLAPTPFAETLRAPLLEALARVDGILDGPKGFDPSASSRTFRLSGSDYFSELLFPQLLREAQSEAPGVSFRLVDMVTSPNVEAMKTLSLDLAFWPRLHFPDWVDVQEICLSTFLICAPKDDPRLAEAGVGDGDAIPIDLYVSFKHAVFAPDGEVRADGDIELANRGQRRHLMATFPTFRGIYQAVAEGGMLGGLPRQLALRYAAEGRITLHPLPVPLGANHLCMIWNRSLSLDPAHAWLRGRVAAIMAQYNDPDPQSGPKGGHV